jgi:hypothetical protein
VKIYVAAMEAPRKKERGDEDRMNSISPSLMSANVFSFASICFFYFTLFMTSFRILGVFFLTFKE